MQDIWIRNQYVSQKTKIRLYKAIVKPVLYNASTWGLTKRKQLCKILNVKYPDKRTNKEVYKLTEETLLSLQITKSRWKLFGHTLRLHKETPARKAMYFYFSKTDCSKFRGRPRMTLPSKLSNNISSASNSDQYFVQDFNVLELKTVTHLDILTDIARERRRWLELTKRICQAAEAAMRL